jgi:VWFA-related protein
MKPAPTSLPAIAVPFLLFLLFCSHLSAQQPNETTPQPGEVKIQVNVSSVVVPVVVRDAKGRAVGNLKKEDFQVFDKDKPQGISGFTIEKRAAAEDDAKTAEPGKAIPAGPMPAVSQEQGRVPDRFIVYLFDDMHMKRADLAGVKSAATKMLAGSLTDSDRAAVISIMGRQDSGITSDRAKLEEAIAKIQTQSPYKRTGRECPDVDFYHADRIENRQDSAALEAAVQDAITCAHLDPKMRIEAETMARSAARESVAQGEQDIRVTLTFVRELIRKMASLPGQRTLILISPGFFAGTQSGMTLQSQVVDVAARANVTISALDPRGLYTTTLEAGESAAGPVSETRLKAESHMASMTNVEDVMGELAEATGGTYFHNSNDFEGGLKRLTVAPEYVYLLEFSIDNVKPDGAYHHLKVKVDRGDLKLQARRGYFAPKPQKNK